MGNVNKVILVGNLGADAELKQTAGGQGYCHLSVATNRVWKDKEGQRQTETEWHRVTLWGELAEQCARHLTKGRSVYIEGRLETSVWENDQKIRRRSTSVIAARVEFLDTPAREAADRAA
jgi:single-strand DNA-binding protein